LALATMNKATITWLGSMSDGLFPKFWKAEAAKGDSVTAAVETLEKLTTWRVEAQPQVQCSWDGVANKETTICAACTKSVGTDSWQCMLGSKQSCSFVIVVVGYRFKAGLVAATLNAMEERSVKFRRVGDGLALA